MKGENDGRSRNEMNKGEGQGGDAYGRGGCSGDDDNRGKSTTKPSLNKLIEGNTGSLPMPESQFYSKGRRSYKAVC